MSDTTLGPMVLLRVIYRDGFVDYIHLPALIIAELLLFVDPEWESVKIQSGGDAMFDWIRSM